MRDNIRYLENTKILKDILISLCWEAFDTSVLGYNALKSHLFAYMGFENEWLHSEYLHKTF